MQTVYLSNMETIRMTKVGKKREEKRLTHSECWANGTMTAKATNNRRKKNRPYCWDNESVVVIYLRFLCMSCLCLTKMLNRFEQLVNELNMNRSLPCFPENPAIVQIIHLCEMTSLWTVLLVYISIYSIGDNWLSMCFYVMCMCSIRVERNWF